MLTSFEKELVEIRDKAVSILEEAEINLKKRKNPLFQTSISFDQLFSFIKDTLQDSTRNDRILNYCSKILGFFTGSCLLAHHYKAGYLAAKYFDPPDSCAEIFGSFTALCNAYLVYSSNVKTLQKILVFTKKILLKQNLFPASYSFLPKTSCSLHIAGILSASFCWGTRVAFIQDNFSATTAKILEAGSSLGAVFFAMTGLSSVIEDSLLWVKNKLKEPVTEIALEVVLNRIRLVLQEASPLYIAELLSQKSIRKDWECLGVDLPAEQQLCEYLEKMPLVHN